MWGGQLKLISPHLGIQPTSFRELHNTTSHFILNEVIGCDRGVRPYSVVQAPGGRTKKFRSVKRVNTHGNHQRLVSLLTTLSKKAPSSQSGPSPSSIKPFFSADTPVARATSQLSLV